MEQPQPDQRAVRADRWDHPMLGFGIGLRYPHYQYILANEPDLDFFEVISENFTDTQGRPLYILDQVAERYPMILHGVSLSIGSTDPLNFCCATIRTTGGDN